MLQALAPAAGESYIDGTFGGGGYTHAILTAAPGAKVLGIDRDPAAIAAGHALLEQYGSRLQLGESRFGDLDGIARRDGFALVDGVVLDIGVSSIQLDDPARGFSFQSDGPLDMRMTATGANAGPSAADVVNTEEEGDLADIIFHLGEER
jgi:16S rRNA (cytosine1402-N4)-methyltransferase